jgi:nitrite reductase (NADH) small subunit
MAEFVKVGELKDFHDKRGRAVDLGGVRVAVFLTGGRFVAFTDACPHMGASLADGRLAGDQVECAWHGWKYDVHTGKNDWKEWACLTVYTVKVEGQDVLILRPDPPPTPPEPPEEDWTAWDPEKHVKKK